MKKTRLSKALLLLLLVSFCTLGFRTSEKTETATIAKALYIDPADMVQGGYYYYWDHGSGAQVAQFDSYDANTGTIYNMNSITPAQLLFTPGGSISVYDAGNISLATLSQILHLLRCVVAGVFVP